MQANLTRLSDLAGEIRRQLKPLGQPGRDRQARPQSIAAVVRDARARLLADEVVTPARRSLAISTAASRSGKTERIVLQEQLDQNQLRAQHIEQAQVGDAVDLARRTAFGLESVQERLRGLYTLANQRLALLGGAGGRRRLRPRREPRRWSRRPRAEAERLRATSVRRRGALWHDAHRPPPSPPGAGLDGLDEQIAAQSALVSRHDLEISQLAGQRRHRSIPARGGARRAAAPADTRSTRRCCGRPMPTSA